MSNNNLSNDLFQFVIRNHESEEIDMKLIRYLNLKNNHNISSDQFVLFNNLEALILDKNYQIVNSNEDQTVHVSNKLRILSLNKCGLNKLSLKNTSTTSLVYLGLAENRLTDMTSTNEYNTFNLFNNLISYNVEHLDFSFNRFHKLSTIKYLLNKLTHLKKLNFEKNLFSLFDTNEIVHTVDSFKKYSSVEINLRFNFIRNTSIAYYKFYNRTNYSRKVSVKLAGNPLVCDCNSLWLLDELNKTIKYQQDLVKKREIEVISKHHNLDDSNTFMQRSKRIKLKEHQHQQQQRRLLFSSNIIQINDLDQMKCNFIDVQNYNENDLLPFSYDNKELNFDLELQKQNIEVKSIKYKEKLISSSTLDDYFCAYEDHCRAGDCDCCVFKHCHCRSICPRLCRCYFDSSLMQNVIDCSALNLIDVPSQSPIESATDMRLNSNTLKMLNSHSFFGFGQVKYLYLQNNQISFIAADSFEDLKYSLKLLNLADNKLSYLNGDEFYGLNELTILVLNSNPLKDIDNINFIGVNHLPSLRFFYLTETTLPAKKLNELIHYSKKSTNTSIRYQLVTTSTVITTKTTTHIATTTTISSNETQSTSTIKANHINTYYFYQLKLFNWYYFPIFVFIICLLLSLVIVITVVIVARKYESDESKNKFKNNKRDSTSDQDFSISFENDMHATTSKQDYHDLSTKPFIKKYNCFNATLVCSSSSSTGSSSSRRESDSISSTSCSIDSKSGGLETDLVSKSIDNLSLEVNIYFNIIDQDYVSNYLLACLKKCNVIIPDTRFVLKPQTTKYVNLNKDYLKKLENNNSNNNLKANILIISDNFSGNRPLGVGGDSLVSIKNYKMSTLNGHNSSSGISSNSSDISIFNDNDSKYKCYLMNWSDDNNSCFKIYLSNNLNNTLMLKDNFNLFNSSKTFSLNQRLMKRIYETSNKSISSDKRVSLQIKNDISSSYAFSDCLKSKLEKYFQHLCLKSATFSERNFSYVDYSKR